AFLDPLARDILSSRLQQFDRRDIPRTGAQTDGQDDALRTQFALVPARVTLPDELALCLSQSRLQRQQAECFQRVTGRVLSLLGAMEQQLGRGDPFVLVQVGAVKRFPRLLQLVLRQFAVAVMVEEPEQGAGQGQRLLAPRGEDHADTVKAATAGEGPKLASTDPAVTVCVQLVEWGGE